MGFDGIRVVRIKKGKPAEAAGLTRAVRWVGAVPIAIPAPHLLDLGALTADDRAEQRVRVLPASAGLVRGTQAVPGVLAQARERGRDSAFRPGHA